MGDKTSGDKTLKILETARDLRSTVGGEIHERLIEDVYLDAARIAGRSVRCNANVATRNLDRTIDRIVTSRIWGFPLMILLFALVFWLTIVGANTPSGMLENLLLGTLYPTFRNGAATIGMPWWLSGFLIDGIYLATAWVVAVMLPPMAIFFPMFTLLEDFGYLPRVAFNLDGAFRRCGAHGKQALTMMMGFGCNAAGVVAARVIDSPRERLIAIITNNFAICNGRWPMQILLATVFIGSLVPSYVAGAISAVAVVGVAVLGILLSFVVSWALSRSVLRGEVSTFTLELPPYRPPRILQTIYTSLIDRTLIILGRAVIFAIPAGAVIWLSANITIGGASIAEHLVGALNPFGVLIGLNGVILVAFIVAIPANEIIIPTVFMLTVLVTGFHGMGEGAGVMFEADGAAVRELFAAGGWTVLTAVNVMLFSLIHNPCSTTIYTIFKETRSWKWTALATLLPLMMGLIITFLVAQVWRILTGVVV